MRNGVRTFRFPLQNQEGRGGTVELITVAVLIFIFISIAIPKLHSLFEVAERTAARNLESGFTTSALLEKPKRSVEGKKAEYPRDVPELLSIADVNSVDITINGHQFDAPLNSNPHTFEYDPNKGLVKEIPKRQEKP